MPTCGAVWSNTVAVRAPFVSDFIDDSPSAAQVLIRGRVQGAVRGGILACSVWSVAERF